MDSKLDSIFRTRFHPAEKTDTWLGIRRQDPQDDRPRKDRDEKEDNPEFGEDNTTLSVTALHGFLNSLLQQAGTAETLPEQPIPLSAESSSEPPPAQPGYRAAASAYQTASQSGGPALINRTDLPPPTAATTPTISLSDNELQTIRRLLRDVEKLARYGGQMITLRPAATFLDSLALGVDEALDSAHP